MKRLLVVLSLVVLAAAAQAQDERVAKPSHDNPSLVTALRNWLAEKTADKKAAEKKAVERTPSTRHVATETRPRRHYRYHTHRYRVPETAEPKIARVAPPSVPTLASLPPAAPVEAPPAATPPVETPAPVANAAPNAPVSAPGGVATPPAPMTASVAPTVPAPASVPAPAALTLPRPVATITVTAPHPHTDTDADEIRPRHGGSQCTTGEKIVTAFYWEGKYTATGERFNPEGMTAAHRTFPFGTKLLIINPRNGKSVTVTINDRGPFTRGVSLDLSRGAAKMIGLQGNAVVCMAKM